MASRLDTTSLVLQARVESTRLPTKVILPFHDDRSLLEILIRRLRDGDLPVPLLVATSVARADDAIEQLAQTQHVFCFRGERDDVLARFLHAAESKSLRGIIRICSDNPFLQISSARRLSVFGDDAAVDYAGYFLSDGTPAIKTHLGLFAEYVSVDALRRVAQLDLPTLYTQHVTNYIYEHPQDFNIQHIAVPHELEGRDDLRLTVDTAEDFAVLQALYSEVIRRDPQLRIETILNCVDERPDWAATMKEQIQRNEK